MRPFSLRILEIFKNLDRDKLDLHALFDIGGNEPDSHNAVLDAVDELVREGCWTVVAAMPSAGPNRVFDLRTYLPLPSNTAL